MTVARILMSASFRGWLDGGGRREGRDAAGGQRRGEALRRDRLRGLSGPVLRCARTDHRQRRHLAEHLTCERGRETAPRRVDRDDGARGAVTPRADLDARVARRDRDAAHPRPDVPPELACVVARALDDGRTVIGAAGVGQFDEAVGDLFSERTDLRVDGRAVVQREHVVDRDSEAKVAAVAAGHRREGGLAHLRLPQRQVPGRGARLHLREG